ncbi:MAG: HAMP domain-containing histidine kinase [Chitinophagaceae bacterium]|nr:HAMP domain-containing histidine kinase [Chitinophagaceae bacterium]
MKTIDLVSVDRRSDVSLSLLVDKITERYSSPARENFSAVINNVNARLRLSIDENLIGSIISSLLKVMVMHSRHGLIIVSAKELYGKMIEFNIKDENCCNTYGIALSLQDVVPLAEKAGGRLNILNRKQKITTVSFSFPLTGEEEKPGLSFL